MENKIHWFKPKKKIKVNNWNHRLIQLVWLSSRQLIMWLSSVYGLHVPVCTHNIVWPCSWWVSGWCPGGSPPRPDQGISAQSVWYLAAADTRYITSHRCSIGSRSGEHEGRSMASMPSSSRNCLHTLATWGRALCCTRRNPGPTAPV